jgi:hypothetical protein
MQGFQPSFSVTCHQSQRTARSPQKMLLTLSLIFRPACPKNSDTVTKFTKGQKVKVWWQDATLFVYFSYFITYIHLFNHIHSIHLSFAIRWGLSPFPHCLYAQWGNTSLWCRAENRTRACLTASRRATNWATPHHTEPRRTITEPHRTKKLTICIGNSAPFKPFCKSWKKFYSIILDSNHFLLACREACWDTQTSIG